MDKNSKNHKFFSIIIVPHHAHSQPISFKIPVRWVYGMLFFLAFSVLLVCSSVVYSTLISRRLVNYSDTLIKNKAQQDQISSFSLKTNQVSKAIQELVKEDNELRRLLGLAGWKNKASLIGHSASPESSINEISNDIERAKELLSERKKSFVELKQWVNTIRTRLSSLPNGWPIRGRIVSKFGYRSYPWRGMHTGIDLDAHYGTPARATAPGVVTYVGWRRGYGKLVEVTHVYGIKTLYAHNSAFAVREGERVNRGQIVSYVGMTGWTTGPHLHYEVRRSDIPVNPMAYLNTDILSASRLWGKYGNL